MEAETQIQIAANLSYIGQSEADESIEQAGEIGRMMNGLTRALKVFNRQPAINRHRQLTTDNRQSTDNR